MGDRHPDMSLDGLFQENAGKAEEKRLKTVPVRR